MRIPERAKPPKGGDRTATDRERNFPARWSGSLARRRERFSETGQLRRGDDAQSARSRAKVAAVLGRTRNGCRLIIPPTPSRPGTEGVAERMLVKCAFAAP